MGSQFGSRAVEPEQVTGNHIAEASGFRFSLGGPLLARMINARPARVIAAELRLHCLMPAA